MSGHIVKIMLENTHPPVWRKIAIPEHISFYCLHKIIQTAFGWEDYHLHEFTPSNTRLRIMDPEGEKRGDVLSEYTTDLEDFLTNYKWIRYTYDFGDDWQHKITYENDYPDYHERYATIIKVNGDNFMEDCGGVWKDEDDVRTRFDLDATNTKIKSIECSVVEGSKKSKEAAHFHKNEEEMRQLAKEMMATLRKTAKMEQVSSNIPSKVQKKLEQWDIFCEEKQKYESTIQKETSGDFFHKEKQHYEQLILPGIEMPLELEKTPSGRYVLEKRESEHRSKEFLQHLDLIQIKDYCKYLGIPVENLIKNKLVDVAWEFLISHPQYYLYVLCKEDVRYFKKILALPEGEIPSPPFADTINRAVLLGLIDIKIEREKEKETTFFYIAADTDEIFINFKESFCEGIYKDLKIRNERISYCVNAYGIIELNHLYEKYVEAFKEDIVKEDFFRVVYWHCRFNDFVTTMVSSKDGSWYVASKVIDALKVYKECLKYEVGADYYPFSKKELLSLEKGYGELYPCWHELASYFQQRLGMDREMTITIVNECYIHVINGETLREILEAMETWYYADTIMETLELWYILTNICLKTGLPMLKGYSRLEYAKRTEKNPYELNIIDEEMIDDPIEVETLILDMPITIQQELMDITSTSDIILRIRNLENIFRNTGGNNDEIMYLLTSYYIEAEKFSKAEKMLERLDKLCSEDESVMRLKEILSVKLKQRATISDRNSFENPLDMLALDPMTYHREKKIGRNEICPCGSGKKYKHCCGRNI